MIQLFRPAPPVEETLNAIRPVLESGWLGTGKVVEQLEGELSKRFNARYVVCTSSGTAALHLAVRSLGLPEGALVLTTPVTFVATNMVLLYERLIPMFVDVEARTGNIAVQGLVKGAAAIMVVHLGGYPCDMDAINEFADKQKIPVIEDCAHAFGARYRNGSPMGDTDNLCCWSFHAVKNLPMGDGGAVSTNNRRLAERLRRLRWMGIDRSTHERSTPEGYSPQYVSREVGYKYAMNDLTAAVGLAALQAVDAQNARRRMIALHYLQELPEAAPNYVVDCSAYHFLPLFFPNGRRRAVRDALEVAKIEWGLHYIPHHLWKPFSGLRYASLESATRYAESELTLPLHPLLEDNHVDRIVETLKHA